jgi:hypothetical protein
MLDGSLGLLSFAPYIHPKAIQPMQTIIQLQPHDPTNTPKYDLRTYQHTLKISLLRPHLIHHLLSYRILPR